MTILMMVVLGIDNNNHGNGRNINAPTACTVDVTAVNTMLQKLQAFDFSPVIHFLTLQGQRNHHDYFVGTNDSVNAIQEFQRFFIIKILDQDFDDTIYAPSLPIEQFWKAFLLFPKDYQRLCNALCGRVIDFNPFHLDSNLKANPQFVHYPQKYNELILRYEQVFQVPPPEKYFPDDISYDQDDVAVLNNAAAGAKITVHVVLHDALHEHFNVSVEVSPQNRIVFLKSLIFQRNGVPKEQQQLFFHDTFLEAYHRVSDYQLHNDCFIKLRLKMRRLPQF